MISKEKNNIVLLVTSSDIKLWYFTHGVIFTAYTDWILYWWSGLKLSSTHHWIAKYWRLGVKEKTQDQREWAELDGHRHSLPSVLFNAIFEAKATSKFISYSGIPWD